LILVECLEADGIIAKANNEDDGKDNSNNNSDRDQKKTTMTKPTMKIMGRTTVTGTTRRKKMTITMT
jgi:hypothetical protein